MIILSYLVNHKEKMVTRDELMTARKIKRKLNSKTAYILSFI